MISLLQLPQDSLIVIVSYLPSPKAIFHDFALVNSECYHLTRSSQFWNFIDGDLRFQVKAKSYLFGYKGISLEWLHSVLKHQDMCQLVLSNAPISPKWSISSLDEDKDLIERNCRHIRVKNLFNFHSYSRAQSEQTPISLVALFVNTAVNLESLHIQNVKWLNGLDQELLFYRICSNETCLNRLVLRQTRDLNIKGLCKSLKSNTTICFLDLSGNEIGVKGGRYIAELLSENCTITELNLFGCFIEVQGTMALSQALSTHNRTLISLDLGMNRVRNTGFISLINSIFQKRDCVLKKLKLTFNMISDKGVNSIQKDLHLLPLDYLDLSCNYLSPAKCIEISTVSNQDQSGYHMNIVLEDMTQNFKKCDKRTIYFSPINDYTKEDEIRQFFLRRIGVRAEKITIKKHNILKAFARYALIEFKDKMDAQKCVNYRLTNRIALFQSHNMTIALKGGHTRGDTFYGNFNS